MIQNNYISFLKKKKIFYYENSFFRHKKKRIWITTTTTNMFSFIFILFRSFQLFIIILCNKYEKKKKLNEASKQTKRTDISSSIFLYDLTQTFLISFWWRVIWFFFSYFSFIIYFSFFDSKKKNNILTISSITNKFCFYFKMFKNFGFCLAKVPQVELRKMLQLNYPLVANDFPIFKLSRHFVG